MVKYLTCPVIQNNSYIGITSIQTQNFLKENYFKKLLFFEKNSENYYTLGNIQKKNKFKMQLYLSIL